MKKFLTSTIVALFTLNIPAAYAGALDLSSLKANYARPDAAFSVPGDALAEQKIALGKTLFFDPLLSGSNDLACASCHAPQTSWQDVRGRSIGAAGKPLSRATPTIMDVAWRKNLMWDGRFSTLEEQAWGPITSAAEMNQDAHELVREIKNKPAYRQKFARAFPRSTISRETIGAALAAFERTVRSPVTPFDRWVAGEKTAISPSAARGFALFNGKANCKACHSGWMFTDDQFHDIGLPGSDLGRGALHPDEAQLQHAFKTPTLRNIADRSPYMHDGSKKSLADVLRHYEEGIVLRPSLSDEVMPPRLSATQTIDLLAFLKTLN